MWQTKQPVRQGESKHCSCLLPLISEIKHRMTNKIHSSYCCVEIGSLHVALVDLELTMKTRLTANLQRTILISTLKI